MQHVREIPFEVLKQYQLGLRTELAALKIVSDVAKKLQAKVRRMVLPPKPASWTRGVGECDAILLTDVAVFLVEVKRYGAQFKLLDDTSPHLTLIRDRKEEQVRNPALEVCSKSDALGQLLDCSPLGRGRVVVVGQQSCFHWASPLDSPYGCSCPKPVCGCRTKGVKPEVSGDALSRGHDGNARRANCGSRSN